MPLQPNGLAIPSACPILNFSYSYSLMYLSKCLSCLSLIKSFKGLCNRGLPGNRGSLRE